MLFGHVTQPTPTSPLIFLMQKHLLSLYPRQQYFGHVCRLLYKGQRRGAREDYETVNLSTLSDAQIRMSAKDAPTAAAPHVAEAPAGGVCAAIAPAVIQPVPKPSCKTVPKAAAKAVTDSPRRTTKVRYVL